MTVDAVIFDWGGTLTPWHTFDPLGPWQMCARAVHETGDPTHHAGGVEAAAAVVAADAIAAKLVAAEDDAWTRARDRHESTTLEAIFAAAGVRAHERMVEAYFTAMEPHTFTDPDVPSLFRGLRERGIRVGVLSNTTWPRSLHERIFARDGVLDLIDGAVYSCEIPWTKPHPEAFRAALAAVGVPDPGRAVYVGDRLYDDVHGATSVGMRAIHVPHSEIPDHQLGAVQGRPDASIDRLADILAVVDRWRVAGDEVLTS